MKTESMFKVRREDLHNFTREENDGLTRVGPATLMGNLMRQYWIPVVPTAQLKEPGGRPLRVRLLGEDLVLFRTTDRRRRADRRLLPAPPRAALFRTRRSGRPALRLSRLEVCARRQVHRDAEHSQGPAVQR